MRGLITYVLSCSMLFALIAKGQDMLPTQDFLLRHYGNPSYTAFSSKDYRVLMASRRQWGWLPGGYTTHVASGEMGMLQDRSGMNKLGVGLVVFQDRAGKPALQTFSGQANIAVHQQVDAGLYFSSGISMKYVQRNLSFEGLRWDAQYNGATYDPSADSGESWSNGKRSLIDLAWGMAISSASMHAETSGGYAFHHLRQEQTLLENGKSRLPMLHEFSFRHRQNIGKTEFFGDGRLGRQAGAMQISVAGRMGYRFGADSRYTDFRTSSLLYGGIGIRWKDAILILAGFEFERKLSLGVAYELTTSWLSQASRQGAMELVLSWSGFRSASRRNLSK